MYINGVDYDKVEKEINETKSPQRRKYLIQQYRLNHSSWDRLNHSSWDWLKGWRDYWCPVCGFSTPYNVYRRKDRKKPRECFYCFIVKELEVLERTGKK
jgi:hypothetical protein